jgi:glycosyltransferase involved in cell wall biosynthesis
VWRLLRLLEHVVGMTKLVFTARQFDVIHVQWLPVPILDIVVVWLLSKFRPIVYTVHDLYPHDSRKSVFLKILFRGIYNIPQALVVHSQNTANGLFQDFGIEPAKLHRINHGNFDYLFHFALESARPLTVAVSPIVLFFGNIRKNKGLDVLLKAMAEVVKEVPAAKLLVVGIPRVDITPYKELVRKLSLSMSVEFRLGYVDESQIPAIFNSASVVVLPYRVIDQSGVLITACTFGKSIVATEIGGLKELVQEARNGILVPVEDEVTLAEAIVEILQNEKLRKEYEQNSKMYSETELNWDTVARQTIDVYTSVLRRRS